ncbi:MAG: hypothetical protein ACJ790_06745 [Myxococcaceae bacterium]
MRRVAGLLLMLHLAAASAQTFSSPFTFAPVLPGTGLAGDSVETKAAFDGTNYLFAWIDFRRTTEAGDVYAARVTASGTVLDPGGIPVSIGPGGKSDLRLVFDGTNYLLVWEGDSSGHVQVYGAHVSPGGQVLEPNGFALSPSDSSQNAPVVVANGTDAMVVWSEYVNSGSDLFALRVGTGGPIGTANQVSDVPGDQWAGAMAFNGTEYMIFLSSGPNNGADQLFGYRLDSAGAAMDSAPFLLSPSADVYSQFVAGSDGTDFFVSWTEQLQDRSHDVRASVVTAAGVAATPSGLAIATSPADEHQLTLTWNGTEYVLAFFDSNQDSVIAERITPAGAILDPAGIELSGGYLSDPALTCTSPGQCALFFMDGFEQYREPFFQRFTTALQPIDAAPVTAFSAPSAQRGPRASSDGIGALLVWEEDRGYGDGFDLFARRVSLDGGVQSPILTVGSGTGEQEDPDVDFAFGQYLVAYMDDETGGDGRHLFVRRVTPDGTFADSTPVLVSDRSNIQSHPRIAHDGSNWMVTWAAYDNTSGHDIWAARVTPAGSVLEPNGFKVVGTGDGEYAPSIAFNGTEYAIGWESYNDVTSSDVLAARVTVDGTVLDQFPVVTIDNGKSYQNEVTVASDGRGFLFAYRSWEIWPGDIYVRRMRADGTLADADRIEVVAGNRGEGSPQVVHDGRTYWLTWEDFRDPVGVDLYGTTITSSGVVTTPQGAPWVANPAQQTDPSLRAVARGKLLLLYTEPDDDAGVQVGRARGEWISDLAPQGGFCLSAAECKTGFCVDGVCCDTACGGGDAGDCLACSEAMGAPVDGTCVPSGAGTVCRAAAARCDLPEACDGVATSCPADEWVPDGGVCRLEDGGYERKPPYQVGFACSQGSSMPWLVGAMLVLAMIWRARRRRA